MTAAFSPSAVGTVGGCDGMAAPRRGLKIQRGNGLVPWTWTCNKDMDMEMHHGHGYAPWTGTATMDMDGDCYC